MAHVGHKLATFGAAVLAGAAPQVSAAETLLHIGSSEEGAELYVDRDSMRSMRPLPGTRPFDAVQIWAIFDLQGVRRDPGRQERALYSFDCRRRTSNILAYRKLRANGTPLHDWRAADLDFKYTPVEPGSLVEQAMMYACSGGRMPVVPSPGSGLTPVEPEVE